MEGAVRGEQQGRLSREHHRAAVGERGMFPGARRRQAGRAGGACEVDGPHRAAIATQSRGWLVGRAWMNDDGFDRQEQAQPLLRATRYTLAANRLPPPTVYMIVHDSPPSSIPSHPQQQLSRLLLRASRCRSSRPLALVSAGPPNGMPARGVFASSPRDGRGAAMRPLLLLHNGFDLLATSLRHAVHCRPLHRLTRAHTSTHPLTRSPWATACSMR